MRKLERLPTRECEAGYGIGSCKITCKLLGTFFAENLNLGKHFQPPCLKTYFKDTEQN